MSQIFVEFNDFITLELTNNKRNNMLDDGEGKIHVAFVVLEANHS